jgi:hypothetical protein
MCSPRDFINEFTEMINKKFTKVFAKLNSETKEEYRAYLEPESEGSPAGISPASVSSAVGSPTSTAAGSSNPILSTAPAVTAEVPPTTASSDTPLATRSPRGSSMSSVTAMSPPAALSSESRVVTSASSRKATTVSGTTTSSRPPKPTASGERFTVKLGNIPYDVYYDKWKHLGTIDLAVMRNDQLIGVPTEDRNGKWVDTYPLDHGGMIIAVAERAADGRTLRARVENPQRVLGWLKGFTQDPNLPLGTVG